MRRMTMAVALALFGCAGCAPSGAPPLPSPAPTPLSTAPVAMASDASHPATQPGLSSPARPPHRSPGWTVTVYYTAVERFHNDAATQVTGCEGLRCSHGDADLGRYPTSFVHAVKDEGTGRTAAGRYLNWSYDIGYWLDDAPRDTAGHPLRPFESAAADADIMAAGTRFTIATCGTDDDGGPIPGNVCGRFRAAHWVVTDEFTPGLGGEHHVDVYLGEETGPRFTDSDWYTTLNRASLDIA